MHHLRKRCSIKTRRIVRQLYTTRLINQYGCSNKRLAFEYSVNFGRETKKSGIVIIDKDRADTAYIIVELKKPKLKDGKDQLRSYRNATSAPIEVWTNGKLSDGVAEALIGRSEKVRLYPSTGGELIESVCRVWVCVGFGWGLRLFLLLVFTLLPANRANDSVCYLGRQLFKFGGHGVVPAIEVPE